MLQWLHTLENPYSLPQGKFMKKNVSLFASVFLLLLCACTYSHSLGETPIELIGMEGESFAPVNVVPEVSKFHFLGTFENPESSENKYLKPSQQKYFQSVVWKAFRDSKIFEEVREKPQLDPEKRGEWKAYIQVSLQRESLSKPSFFLWFLTLGLFPTSFERGTRVALTLYDPSGRKLPTETALLGRKTYIGWIYLPLSLTQWGASASDEDLIAKGTLNALFNSLEKK
jgi:hypothetical protein